MTYQYAMQMVLNMVLCFAFLYLYVLCVGRQNSHVISSLELVLTFTVDDIKVIFVLLIVSKMHSLVAVSVDCPPF